MELTAGHLPGSSKQWLKRYWRYIKKLLKSKLVRLIVETLTQRYLW